MRPPIEILKRAGGVLIVTGLIDIGFMVYCIFNGLSYASSLNIFAVVAGVLLWQGRLGIASAVHAAATFALGAICAALIAFPFLFPADLMFTAFRLYPANAVIWLLFFTAAMILAIWLGIELGQTSVRLACLAKGMRIRRAGLCAVTGAGFSFVVAVVMYFSLNGESAEQAKAMAQRELGAGYRYFVTGMQMNGSGEKSEVDATVTAWTKDEIRHVLVHWQR